MRRIKFRAWCHHRKIMLPDVSISNGIPVEFGYQWINQKHGDMIPMQFAGLQDKNGVDIYEGDILRGYWGRQDSKDKSEIIGHVEYRNGCFVWNTWLKPFTNFDGKHGIRWREWFPNGDEFREVVDIAIIGNIYENPDLLEQSK